MADIHDEEKHKISDAEVHQLERRVSQESDLSNQAHIDALTPEEQKKLIWRVDCRLVLTCGFMYCVSLMDRTNLGIAAVGGMAAGMLDCYSSSMTNGLIRLHRSCSDRRLSIQYHHPGFLHHIRATPTPGHSCASKSWPTSILAVDHHPLGSLCYVLRVPHRVDTDDRSQTRPWYLRGWLLPGMCIPVRIPMGSRVTPITCSTREILPSLEDFPLICNKYLPFFLSILGSRAGIPVTTCRREMPYSTSSDLWHQHFLVS